MPYIAVLVSCWYSKYWLELQPFQVQCHDMITSSLMSLSPMSSGGRFKNAYELLNLRALKISMLLKITSFNVWVRYFEWNFKGYLWNSAQNIIPIHWKMRILFTGENWRALRFKSSYVFLKRPPAMVTYSRFTCIERLMIISHTVIELTRKKSDNFIQTWLEKADFVVTLWHY